MIWFWRSTTLWEFITARAFVGLGSGTFIPSARRAILSNNPSNPGAAISLAGAADIGGFLIGMPIALGIKWLVSPPHSFRILDAYGDGRPVGVGSDVLHDAIRAPHFPFLVFALLLLVVGPIATLIKEPDVHESHPGTAEVRAVLRIPLARAGILVGLGFAALIGTFDAIASRFIRDLGGREGAIMLVMGVLFVPLVLAMPSAGRLVDRLGPIRCGSTALLAGAVVVVGFGLTRNLVGIAALGAIAAICFAVVYTAGQAGVAAGTLPLGLTGAGQGAYEAIYAIGSMTAALVSPSLYRRTDASLMWFVVAMATAIAGVAAYLTAGKDRRAVPHIDDMPVHTAPNPQRHRHLHGSDEEERPVTGAPHPGRPVGEPADGASPTARDGVGQADG
ncbi:MAG: MFS transporter [Microthrixaceae bacterium]